MSHQVFPKGLCFALCCSFSTKFVLYADDILVYKPFYSLDDHHLFQSDLSAISNWLAHNCMSLNAAKCKYMLISRKRSSLPSILPTLFIGSPEATMEKVTSMKYLGVHISSDLSWSTDIDIITSKVRRTLGFIYRKFYRNVNSSVLTKLYTTLVRPLLEYCCAVWDPHLQKDIDKLESVQRLFRSRFQTHPMSTRHVSANSLYTPYELLCSKYLNSMEWPPPSSLVCLPLTLLRTT